MPEPTQVDNEEIKTRKPFRKVECQWCGTLVIVRNIQWHFLNRCSSCPRPKDGTRICSSCHKHLSLDEFPNSVNKPMGKDNTCLECHRHKRDEWVVRQSAHPLKGEYLPRPNARVMRPCRYCGVRYSAREIFAHQRTCSSNPRNTPRPPKKSQAGNSRYRSEQKRIYVRYGITEGIYREMLVAQDHQCAICGRPHLSDNGKTERLHIDHDHFTKEVRGLICSACNLGLGKFRDDAGLLLKAANYLLRYRNPEMVA